MSKLLDGNILCSPAPPAYYCDKAEGGEGVRGSNRLNPNIIESKGSEGLRMNEWEKNIEHKNFAYDAFV